jgi:hypothetical protein
VIAALVLAAASFGDVQPFVEKNTTVLAVERGDLNRDGREDAVLVLEPEDPIEPRPMLILVRDAKGTLKLSKRSANAVACKECGGTGDPLQSIHIEKGRFTVELYGGRSSRWSASYSFAWSRRDQSWQLVHVKLNSHASELDEVETTVHTPPKDFGLIDVTEFDPEDYLGKGIKN